MIDKLDQAFRFHQNALSLRAERQQVLASNIANADTPNYKARDFDFRAALQAAMGQGAIGQAVATAMAQGGVPAAASHPRHLAVTAATAGSTPSGQALLYRTPRQDSIDGNSVELDAERAQFADNALRYEASLSAINGRIKSLLAVIQGQ